MPACRPKGLPQGLQFCNFDYFDQATQKKIKKAILYGKFNFNDANYHGIIMMSKPKAPIHSYKNPTICYQNGVIISKPSSSSKLFSFKHFFTTNEASYDDLELNPVPTLFNNLFQSLENSNCFLFVCLFVWKIQQGSPTLKIQQCSPTLKNQGVPTLPPTKK